MSQDDAENIWPKYSGTASHRLRIDIGHEFTKFDEELDPSTTWNPCPPIPTKTVQVAVMCKNPDREGELAAKVMDTLEAIAIRGKLLGHFTACKMVKAEIPDVNEGPKVAVLSYIGVPFADYQDLINNLPEVQLLGDVPLEIKFEGECDCGTRSLGPGRICSSWCKSWKDKP